jgi:hypothetical protein
MTTPTVVYGAPYYGGGGGSMAMGLLGGLILGDVLSGESCSGETIPASDGIEADV